MRVARAMLAFFAVLILFSGCVKEKQGKQDFIIVKHENRTVDYEKQGFARVGSVTVAEETMANTTPAQNKDVTIADGVLPTPEEPGQNESMGIAQFVEWGKVHNISLIGVNKTTDEFYFNGSREGDFLPIENVPNALEAAFGLYKMPKPLLRAMNGKAFYLSHLRGRGYTVLGSWPEQGILAGMQKGSILEQTINGQQAIDEFAHILDYHGIRGIYEDRESHWKHLESERTEIFAVPFAYDASRLVSPAGYMDAYSTANDAENFAQHFSFYILNGREFREKTGNDSLLKRKYLFFRDRLFDGKEYE